MSRVFDTNTLVSALLFDQSCPGKPFTSEEVRACRDASDDKFLEVIVNGHASCLVSGDKDLLSLHPFRGIPILSPADFLKALSQEA